MILKIFEVKQIEQVKFKMVHIRLEKNKIKKKQ